MTPPGAARKVVDTNIAVAANKRADVGPECVLRCVAALGKLTRCGTIVIDDGWRIIREYRQQLNETGQPGPGDGFLKWILTNLKNPQRCIQVSITPMKSMNSAREDYQEFPRHPQLQSFDPADRKFVAVAMAVDGGAPILQATDRKWWAMRGFLHESGVRVEYVCPQEISRPHS